MLFDCQSQLIPTVSVQYDKYYTPASTQPSNTEAQAPSSGGQYGRTWMLAAVKKRQESDRAQLSPRAELQTYLNDPLQSTSDVVRWWGVRFWFLSSTHRLITCRNIKSSTQRFHGWLETTSPSKVQLPHPSVHFLVVVLQAPSPETASTEKFSKNYSF